MGDVRICKSCGDYASSLNVLVPEPLCWSCIDMWTEALVAGYRKRQKALYETYYGVPWPGPVPMEIVPTDPADKDLADAMNEMLDRVISGRGTFGGISSDEGGG